MGDVPVGPLEPDKETDIVDTTPLLAEVENPGLTPLLAVLLRGDELGLIKLLLTILLRGDEPGLITLLFEVLLKGDEPGLIAPLLVVLRGEDPRRDF